VYGAFVNDLKSNLVSTSSRDRIVGDVTRPRSGRYHESRFYLWEATFWTIPRIAVLFVGGHVLDDPTNRGFICGRPRSGRYHESRFYFWEATFWTIPRIAVLFLGGHVLDDPANRGFISGRPRSGRSHESQFYFWEATFWTIPRIAVLFLGGHVLDDPTNRGFISGREYLPTCSYDSPCLPFNRRLEIFPQE